MHLRRALLLMAVVLGAVALVEAIVPVPRQRRVTERPAAAPPPGVPAPVRTLELRYPARHRPPRRRVSTGAHVVIEVAASAPGQAAVPALGLVQPAEPDTPARFDLLAGRPGSYDVTFDPAAGAPARVGRLEVRWTAPP